MCSSWYSIKTEIEVNLTLISLMVSGGCLFRRYDFLINTVILPPNVKEVNTSREKEEGAKTFLSVAGRQTVLRFVGFFMVLSACP